MANGEVWHFDAGMKKNKALLKCPIDPGSHTVIGHGIVRKDIPIMARLAKARRWSKRWQTCLSSPDLAATQISDGAKIQVRRRHVLRIDPTKS
jgi:hypothetical protein